MTIKIRKQSESEMAEQLVASMDDDGLVPDSAWPSLLQDGARPLLTVAEILCIAPRHVRRALKASTHPQAASTLEQLTKELADLRRGQK